MNDAFSHRFHKFCETLTAKTLTYSIKYMREENSPSITMSPFNRSDVAIGEIFIFVLVESISQPFLPHSVWGAEERRGKLEQNIPII